MPFNDLPRDLLVELARSNQGRAVEANRIKGQVSRDQLLGLMAQGASVQTIAEHYRISRNAAKKRMSRARNHA